MCVKSIYAESISSLVACCMLRYLKRAPCKGLYYRPSFYLDILGYLDVDWADNPIDRHSPTSYCTFIEGCLVT